MEADGGPPLLLVTITLFYGLLNSSSQRSLGTSDAHPRRRPCLQLTMPLYLSSSSLCTSV